MPIDISNNLSQAEYENLRYALIAQLEDRRPNPYFDNATPPLITIGIGFQIDTGNEGMRTTVMNAMEISDEQQENINRNWNYIQGATSDQDLFNRLTAAAGQAFTMTDGQMRDVFNTIVDGSIGFDTIAQGFTGVTAFSFERAVFCSLQYNTRYNPPDPRALLGPSLLRALNQYTDPAEARAEVWYQIRYNTDDQDKRRIIESELFGLYADRNAVTVDQAKGVYRIYTLHKDEQRNPMNTTEDNTLARGYNLAAGDIAEINRILGNLNSSVSVPTSERLVQQLDYGKIALINDLNANAGLNENINPDEYLSTDIMIDPGRNDNTVVTIDPNRSATLTGSERNDIILGEGGNDTLSGADGNDVLHGGEGDDTLSGGVGDDILIGDKGKDILNGGKNNDTIYGGDDQDTIDGGEGDDYIYGEGGADIINGGDGDDTIYGGDDQDTIDGGAGDDIIFGDAGIDIIDGGDDNDYVWGGDDGDLINGGDGDDHLFGEGGIDNINGGAGNDFIRGGEGGDVLNGGSGNDRIFGDAGNDLITGGEGADELYGGAGDDVYVADNGDTILDSDHKGRVLFGGTVLSGGTKEEGKNYWEGNGGKYTFSDGVLTFQIGESGPSLTILNYDNDQNSLGIYLEEDDKESQQKFSSPLVLDLNNNGTLSVTEYDSPAYFDLDGDGFKEKTGWVEAEDGLLALDKDESGTIDTGNDTLLITLAKTMYNGKRQNVTPLDFKTLRRAA